MPILQLAHGWEQLSGRLLDRKSARDPKARGWNARRVRFRKVFSRGEDSRFHGTCLARRPRQRIFENHAFRDCAGRAPAVRFQRIELYWEARRGPWMEGPSVSLSRVPRAGSPAACLHVTPGGPTYHVLRAHAYTRTRESSRASRARPLNYREAGFVRGVAVLAPDYDLLRVLFFFISSLSSFDANSKKCWMLVPMGTRGQDLSSFLGFDSLNRCNLDIRNNRKD